jgi:transposase-like protein
MTEIINNTTEERPICPDCNTICSKAGKLPSGRRRVQGYMCKTCLHVYKDTASSRAKLQWVVVPAKTKTRINQT